MEMLEIIIILGLGIWLYLAIRNLRKNKKRCNGQCAICAQRSSLDICSLYHQDKEGEKNDE